MIRSLQQVASEDARPGAVPLARLLTLARPQWPYLAFGMLASAAIGASSPIMSILFSGAVAAFAPTAPRSEGVKYALLLFGRGGATGLAVLVSAYCFARVGAALAARVRRRFFAAALHMEVAWFDNEANASGALSARLAADAPVVRGAVGDRLGIAVQLAAVVVTAFSVALASGWRMSLVAIGPIPLIAALVSLMQLMLRALPPAPGLPKCVTIQDLAVMSVICCRPVHLRGHANATVMTSLKAEA